MQIGIIGVGVVGGTLRRWFFEHTDHDIRCVDPYKGMDDPLEGCSAIFVSVPVPATPHGQDLKALKDAVALAKKYTSFVFIRSTVLPGTNRPAYYLILLSIAHFFILLSSGLAPRQSIIFVRH